MSRFLQLHSLSYYSNVLLNRGEDGRAKRVHVGLIPRVEITSQCKKFSIRQALIEQFGKESFSVRSRLSLKDLVYVPLLEQGVEEKIAKNITMWLMKFVSGCSLDKTMAVTQEDEDETPLASEEKDDPLRLSQNACLGHAEIKQLLNWGMKLYETQPTLEFWDSQGKNKTALASQLKDIQKLVKNTCGDLTNLSAMTCGIDSALFGRFSPSSAFAIHTAPVGFAHGFDVSAAPVNLDYQTAFDDLAGRDIQGAAFIGNPETSSILAYQYCTVDIPLLVSNFTGCDRKNWESVEDRQFVREVLRAFANAFVLVSPGAKVGSTAPFGSHHLVFAEVGKSLPRNLAAAFLTPPSHLGNGLIHNAFDLFGSFYKESSEVFGKNDVAFTALGPKHLIAEKVGHDSMESFEHLLNWIVDNSLR